MYSVWIPPGSEIV